MPKNFNGLFDTKMLNLHKKLSLIDVVNFIFWLAIFIFYIISFKLSSYKLYGFVLLTGLLVFQMLIIKIRNTTSLTYWQKLLLLIYPAVFLVMIFDGIHLVLPYINSNVYDRQLYEIDYRLLGVNPTVWIESYINPYLTELMYILYFFYFPMPLIILGYLFRKKLFKELDKSLVFLLVTYYGAYLMYFLVPALGPRYYTELVMQQSLSLDGLWLTDIIRNTISSLEHNKFDAFPSLHTAISLATIIIIAQYRKIWLWFFIPVLIGILVSLIYCRYHYFIDIIGGIIWTITAYWLTEHFYEKLHKKYFVTFISE